MVWFRNYNVFNLIRVVYITCVINLVRFIKRAFFKFFRLRSQNRFFIFVVKMEIGYSNNTFLRMNYDSYFNLKKIGPVQKNKDDSNHILNDFKKSCVIPR